MILHRPLAKVRHLLERFQELERDVASLGERLGDLHSETSVRLTDLRSDLREEASATRDEVLAVRASASHDAASAQEAAGRRFRELRDSVHLIPRRLPLTRPRVRVLFLVHHIESWDSYHAVVEEMRRSAEFEPIVASMPRRFNGSPGLTFEEEVHRGLQARGVPHLRLPAHDDDEALRLVKWIDPDLVFRQSQWDADVPADMGTDRLSFARLCLVPYETMNLVRNVPFGWESNTAVDSAYHRAAWLVCCTNEAVLETARRDGARGGAQFSVTGHPKADRLRAASPSWPIARDADVPPSRRVVWSAHHSIAEGWTDFGLFPSMAEDMLSWAAAAADVDFVFMPHPALVPFTSSPDSPVTREQYDEWQARWLALPNTAVLSDPDYAPVLAASDVMVTDGLSMLVEYQLLQKPLVFVEREGHRPFNEVGVQVLTGTHPVASTAQARELVDRFLAGEPDDRRPQQERNVAELFGPAGAAERIVAAVARAVADERGDRGTARPELGSVGAL